jgi:hypothetical protein
VCVPGHVVIPGGAVYIDRLTAITFYVACIARRLDPGFRHFT